MFSDRYRASDYQNSWPKNYQKLSKTIIRVVKREKLSSLFDYHEEFEQAQTEW